MTGRSGWRAPVEELVSRGAGLPVAARHGARTYFADHRAPRGERHVRVCTGTSCFVASGGGLHVSAVESALAVKAGGRSMDGQVSLQPVHCLGYCYAGPAAIDGDQPMVGPDLADQLAHRVEPRDPPVPVRAHTAPVVLRGILVGDRPWQVWPVVRTRDDSADVIRREVAGSGLRGRGGAGFPVADKWSAVVSADPGQRYVVANGDEGDPGSFADRLLMEQDPARILEGLALAGLACGATAGIVYVRSEYPRARAAMQQAVAEARAAGHLGAQFDVHIVSGHGSYVAGEETSLLRSIVGVRGAVRTRPPYPTEHGLHGRPTAVNNVETLAAVPGIVARGAAAFAERGRPGATGTLLVCLNERFARPGVCEVDFGTPVRDIVEGIGGGLEDGRTIRALQVGGPLGGFIGPEQLDLALLESELAGVGVALGHGSLVAVDDTVRHDALLQHLWRFAASESCGTCTPCREGSRKGAEDPDAATDELLDLMEQASLCAFGRRMPAAVRSLVAVPW